MVRSCLTVQLRGVKKDLKFMKGTPRVFGIARETLAFSFGALVGIGGLALAITAGGCQGGGAGGALPGGDLAVIDGESVPMTEFYKYLAVKQRVRVDVGGRQVNGTVLQTMGFQGLEDLIRDRIVRHIAKDEGVYPSESDVEAEIDFQKRRDPNFLRSATGTGLDLNTIRSQISLQLAAERIVTKGITVTPAEVDKFIADNPSQFKDPATVDLFWILVSSEDQKKLVDSDLSTGQSFSVVASRYSQAEGARTQRGQFPQRVLSRLPIQLQDLINKTGELKATEWVKTTEGWAKWFVDKKTPAKSIKIDDTIKEMVKRQIAIQRGQVANDLDKRVKEKLLASKIDVKQTYYASLWKDEIANLQNAPAGKPGSASNAVPQTKEATK